jgi:hypothetical protein
MSYRSSHPFGYGNDQGMQFPVLQLSPFTIGFNEHRFSFMIWYGYETTSYHFSQEKSKLKIHEQLAEASTYYPCSVRAPRAMPQNSMALAKPIGTASPLIPVSFHFVPSVLPFLMLRECGTQIPLTSRRSLPRSSPRQRQSSPRGHACNNRYAKLLQA